MQWHRSWKSQLTLLWAGQAVLMAMLTMSLPYWPLYIAQLGGYTSKEIRFWSAAIYIAPFVSSIFISPIWGRLSDKYGYKPMVIRACIGLFITQTLILLCSHVFTIFLFRLLQGALAGFIVAAQALALAISPLDERGATIGKLQSATAVGNLFGPLIGGVIAASLGYQAIFSSSSVICLLITILFFFFLTEAEKTNTNEETTKTNHSFKAHFFTPHLSWLQKQIMMILGTIILIQIARAMITPIFSLFVTERLGGNEITVGILYAATGLMIFITAPRWGKFFDDLIRANYPVTIFIPILLFASAVLQVLHAYAHTITLIFILRILWGICLGGLLPVLLRLLVDSSHSNNNGLLLGFGNSATKMGNLLGIILGALIEAYLGFTNSFLVTAFIYFLSGAVFLRNLNSFKMEQVNYGK